MNKYLQKIKNEVKSISSKSENLFSNFFKFVGRGVPNTIGNQIFTEFPMQSSGNDIFTVYTESYPKKSVMR